MCLNVSLLLLNNGLIFYFIFRPKVFVYPCVDGHVTCLECFCEYAVNRLRERRFIFDKSLGYTLPCPAGCPNSLISQPYHFKALTTEHVCNNEYITTIQHIYIYINTII